MKQLLLKYAPLFIALTALADTQMQLLSDIGLTDVAIAWIKLLGLLIALFLPSVSKTFMREIDADNTDPQLPTKPKKIG